MVSRPIRSRDDVLAERKMSSAFFDIVAAVNDDEVLAGNLAASPMIRENKVPLIVERGYDSAALAYNAGLERTTADVVVFAHQDVYLPQGWEQKLLLAIDRLELKGKKWGVLGVVGKDSTGELVGRAWSAGLHREVKANFSNPTPVVSVDELVIVLHKETGLRFDSSLPGYHLYGTDIVQSALQSGFEAYVFDGPVVHNSLPVIQLDRSYVRAYRYLQRKWHSRLPICTTVMPITRFAWPLFRRQLADMKNHVFSQKPPRQKYARHKAPWLKAQELGYEDR